VCAVVLAEDEVAAKHDSFGVGAHPNFLY
jgi:hypothetical protein